MAKKNDLKSFIALQNALIDFPEDLYNYHIRHALIFVEAEIHSLCNELRCDERIDDDGRKFKIPYQIESEDFWDNL